MSATTATWIALSSVVFHRIQLFLIFHHFASIIYPSHKSLLFLYI
jgi:hypothetical protein